MELWRIGAWSEAKLEFIRAYAKPYSMILKNQLGFSPPFLSVAPRTKFYPDPTGPAMVLGQS